MTGAFAEPEGLTFFYIHLRNIIKDISKLTHVLALPYTPPIVANYAPPVMNY